MKRNKLRATLDTNIFLAAHLTRSATSPARELLDRWLDGEFTLLISSTLAEELSATLLKRRVKETRVSQLGALLSQLAEWVEVPAGAVQPVLADPDDNHVLACAVIGQADYLVTHDSDFAPLRGEYQGVRIVETLPFLWVVRGDTPP